MIETPLTHLYKFSDDEYLAVNKNGDYGRFYSHDDLYSEFEVNYENSEERSKDEQIPILVPGIKEKLLYILRDTVTYNHDHSPYLNHDIVEEIIEACDDELKHRKQLNEEIVDNNNEKDSFKFYFNETGSRKCRPHVAKIRSTIDDDLYRDFIEFDSKKEKEEVTVKGYYFASEGDIIEICNGKEIKLYLITKKTTQDNYHHYLETLNYYTLKSHIKRYLNGILTIDDLLNKE